MYQNASIIRHLTIIQPGHTWIAAARVFPQVVRPCRYTLVLVPHSGSRPFRLQEVAANILAWNCLGNNKTTNGRLVSFLEVVPNAHHNASQTITARRQNALKSLILDLP